MSSTSAASPQGSGPPAWQPVLQLGGDHWVGLLNDDELFVGDHEHAMRQVEPAAPTGLLPLLERPLAVVAAEVDEWEVKHRRERGFLARRVPFESLVRHALASGSDYWAGLALEWVPVLPQPVNVATDLSVLESATWAPQGLRHRARKVRRELLAAEDPGAGKSDAR